MIKFTTIEKKEYWLTVPQVIDMVKSWDNIITDTTETGIRISPTVILWIDPVHKAVNIEETISEDEIKTLDIDNMSMNEANELLDWEQALHDYIKRVAG